MLVLQPGTLWFESKQFRIHARAAKGIQSFTFQQAADSTLQDASWQPVLLLASWRCRDALQPASCPACSADFHGPVHLLAELKDAAIWFVHRFCATRQQRWVTNGAYKDTLRQWPQLGGIWDRQASWGARIRSGRLSYDPEEARRESASAHRTRLLRTQPPTHDARYLAASYDELIWQLPMSEDNRSEPSYELEAICRCRSPFDSRYFDGHPWYACHPDSHWSTRQKSDDLSKWTSYNRQRVWVVHFRTLHSPEWKSRALSVSGRFQGLRNARRSGCGRRRQSRNLLPVYLQCVHGLLRLYWQRQARLLRDAALPREGPPDTEAGPCRRDHLKIASAHRRSVRQLPSAKRPQAQ